MKGKALPIRLLPRMPTISAFKCALAALTAAGREPWQIGTQLSTHNRAFHTVTVSHSINMH